MKPTIETIIAADGTPVITARFTPDKAPRGVVLMVHGFGEHHAGYHNLGEFLSGRGYAAVAFDQRGHGENHRNSRGVSAAYGLFLDDIEVMRQKISGWFPGAPAYLYGHSMGGNIAVNYCLKRCGGAGGGFGKLILETPWLRLYKPMPRAVVLAARVIGGISPKPFAVTGMALDDVTRDRERVDAIANDECCHNRLSFRMFVQISDAGEYAVANAGRLTVPTLLLCAGRDKIVSPDAIKEFARAANDNVVLYTEKEGYHALHFDSEPTRGRVLTKMVEFIN